MSDEQLEKQIKDYQDLAKQNPGVNVNMLMMNALASEAVKVKNTKSRKWPYLISLGAPPFGLFFALKYYFSGDEDDKTAANICVLLTIVSFLLLYVFSKMLFSSAGVTPQQIEQITPQEIHDTLQ